MLAGQRITQTLRQAVFSSIVRQEVAFFDKNKTGELVNRLSSDTSLVSQSITMNISDGLRSTVMVVAGVSMMVSRMEYVCMYRYHHQNYTNGQIFKSILTEFKCLQAILENKNDGLIKLQAEEIKEIWAEYFIFFKITKN